MSEKRGRGRPPADDPTVAFRLNKSTRDKLLSHAEHNLWQQARLEHAAAVLESNNKGTRRPTPLTPPTAQAVAAEARRLINEVVEEALDQSPRPKVRRVSPGRVTSRQAKEVVALMEAGGPLERVLYAVLPDWWRQHIDDYEAGKDEPEFLEYLKKSSELMTASKTLED